MLAPCCEPRKVKNCCAIAWPSWANCCIAGLSGIVRLGHRDGILGEHMPGQENRPGMPCCCRRFCIAPWGLSTAPATAAAPRPAPGSTDYNARMYIIAIGWLWVR